jgi:hypothetical protein
VRCGGSRIANTGPADGREREVYGIKRPRQLASQDVFLHIGEPIDLGPDVAPYLRDPQAVRHELTGRLRDEIQALIDAILAAPARP